MSINREESIAQLRKMFDVIGSPFTESHVGTLPTPDDVDRLFDFSFENRVGLLFLQRCKEQGVVLSPTGNSNFKKLDQRRSDTEDIVVKVTELLDEVLKDEWTMFKTIKPFPSTPNDTDLFPFDENKHGILCQHLLDSGFSLLEKAPLQTTLIEDSGTGIADSDKRGGVWYIDCYKSPGADYFKYLDPAKMKRHLVLTEVKGAMIPNLAAPAELAAICYHNVFPERTYSVESFYLILHYLKDMEQKSLVDEFVATVEENYVPRAVSANIAVTRALHRHHFGFVPSILDELLAIFDKSISEERTITTDNYYLPYNFSNPCFWRCFAEKLRDPISLKSLFVQAFHMLNPAFAWGVFHIIWKRTRPGSIYKQM
ncbi:MAG: hypothetical protein ABJ308_09880 [Halieaceae bacterium]